MASKQTEDTIKLVVTLKSGAEFELAGGLAAAEFFHKRFKKWAEGQRHKTDNHRLLHYGGTYFLADDIAAYSAETFSGRVVDLGSIQ